MGCSVDNSQFSVPYRSGEMAKFQPDNRNLITKDPALGLLWMCHAEIAFSGDDVHVSPAVLLFN